MGRPLFVYGTLRDADVLRLVLGHDLAPDQRRAAVAPDCRVVVFPDRTYPALIADPSAAADGTLLLDLDAKDLDLLDRFEGDEYKRAAIELIVSGAPVSADVYWPAQSVAPTQPDWQLAAWQASHKAAFLAGEADNIAGLRQHLSALR